MRRSYGDMLELVQQITAARPQRSPDNVNITLRLIKRLGLEESLHKMKYVHIAGTKGKGTTSVYTSELLRSYGAKVGLFTSPHLVDIRERIQVDGKLLPHATFAKYFFDVYDRHQQLLSSDSDIDRDTASRANFFRLMFLTSIHAFASEGVDVGVMEVGIGGRIDATNIIDPVVCGITSLGMDHMEILGATIEEIASEKAGIIKPRVPCFSVSQSAHPTTRKVIEQKAKSIEAPLCFLDRGVIPILRWPQLAIGGRHAVENAQLALCLARTACDVPVVLPITQGEWQVLSCTTFAGRSQVLPVSPKVTLFLDGAHTPESLDAASKWFFDAARASDAAHSRTSSRNVILFYSTRDPKSLFKAFMPFSRNVKKCILATIHSPKTPSSGEAEDAREHLLKFTECWRTLYAEVPCLPCATPFETWHDIEELVTGSTGNLDAEDDHVNLFVTGSFFLVGDVLKLVEPAQEC